MKPSAPRMTAAVAGLALIAVPGVAPAHHSFAMFSLQKKVTLTGQVKDFQWKNPHSTLVVSVPGKDGATDWYIEMQSVGRIARGGWRRDTIKAGDKVTVEAHPLKDGSNGAGFIAVTLPNGKRMGQTGGSADIPAPGGDEEGLKQAEREEALWAATRR